MEIINYNKEVFDELTKGKILVDFHADWCGYCKLINVEFNKLVSDIKIVKVDVDKEEEMARQYGVMSIPTIILFQDGKEVKRKIGFVSKVELEEFIK